MPLACYTVDGLSYSPFYPFRLYACTPIKKQSGSKECVETAPQKNVDSEKFIRTVKVHVYMMCTCNIMLCVSA